MSEKLKELQHALKEKEPEGLRTRAGTFRLDALRSLAAELFFVRGWDDFETWVCDPRVSETGSASRGSPDEVRYARRWHAVAAEAAFSAEDCWAAKHCHWAWRGVFGLEMVDAPDQWHLFILAAPKKLLMLRGEETIGICRRHSSNMLKLSGLPLPRVTCAPGLVDTNLTLENKTTKVELVRKKPYTRMSQLEKMFLQKSEGFTA